jgi:predicted Zn finger-like uncharacterized protein
MQIVCPHCSTSYAIDPAKFGTAGRTVRCARCKETWLAMPEEIPQPALPEGPAEDDAGWGLAAEAPEPAEAEMPVVASPPITSELPEERQLADDWGMMARQDAEELEPEPEPRGWMARLGLAQLSLGPLARISWPALPAPLATALAWRPPFRIPYALPISCAVMAALVIALIGFRTEVVRTLPQTASFFRMLGLGVNLRALAFHDVRLSTELVDNKPVLIIEGDIVATSKKTVDLPRLRFVVRDDHGTEIYAWNAVLEQSALKAGEKVWFKSRLASPPVEGREITVRFFNRRDLAAGGA